ncbi:hypothetical protein ADN00_08725 [Ornatilinea apprima]|uniref:Uncharacterized protein n=1 Tax=Ornatilinea apprima TaxID=1134406 RepID=A0A0N8GNB9_9CHLR|nr:hypothetical protein [Ornatilinea apprima]KPL77666.1 hypothetical protein ADN00_08725 [Ornatilinea apprima]
MMNIEIWNEVDKRIQNPNEACQFIGKLMENSKDKTFNGLITANFTNTPSEIQNAINKFIYECNKTFELKAIYLEMNGFDINPSRWFFDLFGYEALPEDDSDLDWLSDWQSPDFPDVTLKGLESIQELFKQYNQEKADLNLDKPNQVLKNNHELATLMVMAKFCKLIDESLHNTHLGLHIYATAHDFEIIYHKHA